MVIEQENMKMSVVSSVHIGLLVFIFIKSADLLSTVTNSNTTSCSFTVDFSALANQYEARIKSLEGAYAQLSAEIQSIKNEPNDCTDISRSGKTVSGIYKINVAGRKLDVYCDLQTAGGGWLVFQRRQSGYEDFFRNWVCYEDGFGDISEEFWLGNEMLHLLTSSGNYKLRIDLKDFNGNSRYADYSTFSIGSRCSNYTLTVAGYSGNAGDSFTYHNGCQYSTFDMDHDTWGNNCAQAFKGAWWYKSCHYSNLNGLYLHGNHTSYADGIEWYSWTGHYYSLRFTEMKIAKII